jgi:hypothetical protein
MSDARPKGDQGARAGLMVLAIVQVVTVLLELTVTWLVARLDAGATSAEWKRLEPFFHAIGALFLVASVASCVGAALLARAASGRTRTLGFAAAAGFMPFLVLHVVHLAGGQGGGVVVELGAMGLEGAAWVMVAVVAARRAGRGALSPGVLMVLAAVLVQAAADALTWTDVLSSPKLAAVLRPGVQLAVSAAILVVLYGARKEASPAPAGAASLEGATSGAVDALWSPAAEGLGTLAVLALVRVPVVIGGALVVGVAVATKNVDAAQATVVLGALVSAVTSVLAIVSAVRVASAPGGVGVPAGLAAVGMGIALLVDGYVTSLNLTLMRGMNAQVTSIWSSGFDDSMRAYEAAERLPWVAVGSGVLGVACTLALFAAMAGIARAVGQKALAASAGRGRNLVIAAACLLAAAAAAVNAAPPVALVLALPVVVLGIMGLAVFVSTARGIAAKLRAGAVAS